MRFLVFLLFLVASAQAQSLGTTTFPNSGAAEAQGPFLRGLLLLHSFEYDDAADAFREAQALDPGFAMAFWGEAMTYNHPIWMQQDQDAARNALIKIRATSVLTDREAAYIAVASVLFGDGPKEERDDAFEVAMGELADAYPDDADAAAFHALAILGTAHEGRDYEVYGRAAQIAQRVFEAHPDHPGAAHYLIHAYDDPDHAELALDAARAYSELAPSAAHALHMPTHIFYALGRWDEAVALNIRSFEAARDASARRGEPLNNHGWHALYWLAYAEAQRGERDRAMEVMTLAKQLYDEHPSPIALRHLVMIRAHVTAASELGGADGMPESRNPFRFDLPHAEMDVISEAVDRFVSPQTSAQGTDETFRAENIERIVQLASAPNARDDLKAIALIAQSTGAFSDPTLMAADAARLAEAVDLVEKTPVTFGPPNFVVMPHELLATIAAQVGDYETARCLLDASGARAPNRLFATRIANRIPDSSSGNARMPYPIPAVCAQ